MTFDFSMFDKSIGWIKDRTILLALKGSRAYGTNSPCSDHDYGGVAVPPPVYYHGYSKKFEQAELKSPNPDTTIYDIRKFFNLAAGANPNILDLLFCNDEDVIHITDAGRKLREHRDLFLSKRARFTYAGYSFSQLKRLRSHRAWLLRGETLTMPTRAEFGLPDHTMIPGDQLGAIQTEINKELDRLHTMECLDHLEEADKINVRNTMSEVLAKFRITQDDEWMSAGRLIGLDENFLELMKRERDYAAKKTEYKQYCLWKETRNKERYAMEEKYGFDGKHASHLVRLLRCCREILTTGKVLVRRPDAEELRAIRNGAWTYDQVIEFAESEEKAMEGLYKASTLRHSPDVAKLDALCQDIVEGFL